jgi:acetyl-CoA carboxylase biotin carboxyl carrier protein
VTLTAAEVAEIMRLVETSTFDELNLEIEGVKLTLRRSGGGPMQAVVTDEAVTDGAATAAVPTGTARAPAAAREAVAAATPFDASLRDIASPMLGTFYRAPKPGSAPFVEIGSAVSEDSVIAIIEVMKLMNTVRAGVKGVITEILPADETLVEFGDVLMRARVDV